MLLINVCSNILRPYSHNFGLSWLCPLLKVMAEPAHSRCLSFTQRCSKIENKLSFNTMASTTRPQHVHICYQNQPFFFFSGGALSCGSGTTFFPVFVQNQPFFSFLGGAHSFNSGFVCFSAFFLQQQQ